MRELAELCAQRSYKVWQVSQEADGKLQQTTRRGSGWRLDLTLQETQALPRVPGFAEGFLSGPRQRKSLSRAALDTTVFTALHPLPRVGP
jgi:hypothetical protein